MDSDTMKKKLSILGGEESGLEEGQFVRGTHSRGAKDIASIGNVTFEAIAGDGQYHKCEISQEFQMTLFKSQKPATALRRKIGLKRGTGTLVTLEMESGQKLQQHYIFKDKIRRLVGLREIIRDEKRELFLVDQAYTLTT